MKHRDPRILEAMINYQTQYLVIYCPVWNSEMPYPILIQVILLLLHFSETIMRQNLQKEFIQDGIDSHFPRNLPYANSAHDFDENMSVLESLIASCAGSAESDARNPQSLQTDLTQVGKNLSDHADEDLHASKPDTDNNMISQ